MGFIQPCFIRKSTWHLVNMVYKIGGRGGSKLDLYLEGSKLLLACDRGECRTWDLEFGTAIKLVERGYIDCGTNEELFLAIAALRDDDCYMQYYWYKDKLYKCIGCGSTIKMNGDYSIKLKNEFGHFDIMNTNVKKATVAELIEHFK